MKEKPDDIALGNITSLPELREKVRAQIEQETRERIRKNPVPTEAEILAGAFREMLEPQVRAAVFQFYRKGYATESSGFGGEHGEIQAIDGYFDIDNDTKKKLEMLGVRILAGKDVGMPFESEHFTSLQFHPDQPDIGRIKTRWDEIANLLPPKGKAAEPAVSGAASDFRIKYCPERTDIEKIVKHRRQIIK